MDNIDVPKTGVRYVTGFDRFSNQPDFARTAGLNCRFAVVQDTYRPDIGEMYFDAPLWLSLLDFAQIHAAATAAEVWISLTEKLGKEITPDAFLDIWTKTPAEDREPVSIRVRDTSGLTLVIEPVFWCSVGGPGLYHDSYTYEIYSATSLGPVVEDHLARANTGGWDLGVELSPEELAAWQAELVEPAWWRKIWNWLMI